MLTKYQKELYDRILADDSYQPNPPTQTSYANQYVIRAENTIFDLVHIIREQAKEIQEAKAALLDTIRGRN